jgi:hypothetical protein
MRFTGTTRLIDLDLSEARIEDLVDAVPLLTTSRSRTSASRAVNQAVHVERVERRTRIFQRILGDAGRGAREYVERFKAGRGAE